MVTVTHVGAVVLAVDMVNKAHNRVKCFDWRDT